MMVNYSNEIESLIKEGILKEVVGIYYLIINGKLTKFYFSKKDLIELFTKNNGNVEKIKMEIITKYNEVEIKKKIEEMKQREQKKYIREQAEKKLYGQAKTKRESINETDKEIIFQKFNNECSICGAKEGLHIHHKDKNPANNKISNLIVLCGVCHKKIHMNVR